MKSTIGIKTPGLVWLSVLILLSFFPGAVHAQWTRLGLDEGGVGEDVQLLRLSNNSLGDVVWSANMEGGVFRAVHSSGAWQSWTEYLPGRGMFGVEAICVEDTDYVDMEYVLAATGTMGLWYNQWYIQNPPAAGEWQRPPSNLLYPDNWEHVWTHDAAFFCNTNGSWPQSPEDSFFVILSDTIGDPVQFKPGIYRWDPTLQPPNFTRVDAASAITDPRGFGHFWRDLEDGNVLYVTSPDGIYKLSGSYTSPKFEKLPATTKLEDLPIDRPPANLPPLPKQ